MLYDSDGAGRLALHKEKAGRAKINSINVYTRSTRNAILKKLFNLLIMLMAVVSLAGCSSMSFTRTEKPFDGSRHATSALLCSVYWSNHGFKGKDKSRSPAHRVLPTLGLAFYSTVDLASSFLADIVLYPVQAAGGGPSVAAFDAVPHSLFPCGSIEHSIHVIGAL